MQPTNIIGIKEANIKKIIDILRFRDGMTKKGIAEETGLSFATVSNMCNLLREKAILSDEKHDSVSVGRTPNVLFFSYERFCCVSLNLQMKDHMVLSVLNFRNEVIFQKCYDVAAFPSPKDILDYAKATFDSLKGSVIAPSMTVVGVGISVSGNYDDKTGKLVLCAIPAFTGIDIKRLAEDVFRLPCYVDKESNLCAISVNSRDEHQNLVYLHCSEGVGAGVICEGRLVRGQRGCATEIAHIPLGAPDKACPSCGQIGCIENEISLAGLVDGYQDVLPALPMVRQWEALAEGIRAGNPRFGRFAPTKGLYLGRIAATLVNIFDPSILYVGGNISLVFSQLEPYFMKELGRLCAINCANGLRVICDEASEETISTGLSEAIYKKWVPLSSTLIG